MWPMGLLFPLKVPGRINLRGSMARHQSLNTERADQYLPRQRRDVTYVSRLQAVQAAVDHQLEEMIKQHPNRRVALITFNSEVRVKGSKFVVRTTWFQNLQMNIFGKKEMFAQFLSLTSLKYDILDIHF